MITKFTNLLSTEEKLYLKELCKNFIKNNDTTPDGINNFYNSMHVNDGLDLFKIIVTEIANHNSNGYEIQYNGMFINKITSDTNKNDGYHRDESDLTIVTYLNDDFEGGEFEYKENGKMIKIQPQENLSILMNKTILHRVLPVTNGERYSLVTWFRMLNKNII
jgi:Rps23 Pro-64 3,4-dihydroxylase Tpa1-like proline 4-hydroxylase